ncbi:D-alanyl-D-alanine dipeptidase [Marmoricola endophyticus]|uniref:D-alanyl-D-alanine dipeptidase n=2 Tax=Marmoricola endophyticus TaxID=2040280 RepID=A0A917B8P9_9ACTN|nr:D-alanyl-D-alanine dipeptidase [Marmoricola endophyticus]
MGDPRVTSLAAVDNGEPLVDVRDLGLHVHPDKSQRHPDYFLLRAGVAERLGQARRLLPEPYGLLIIEGYRPFAVQEAAFDRHRRRLADADPSLSDHDVFMAASQYVSPPAVAPHVSGAAVDLTLVDESGTRLDMGTEVDATPEESGGACYFAATSISETGRRHREVLAAALGGAGLVNYPTEWWHWSYGDRYWALVTGAPEAIYGPVGSCA